MGSLRARFWLSALLALCGLMQVVLVLWGTKNVGSGIAGAIVLACGAAQTVQVRREMRDREHG